MYYEDDLKDDSWHRKRFKWVIEYIEKYKENHKSLSVDEMKEVERILQKNVGLEFIPNEYIRKFIQSLSEEDFKKLLCYLFRKDEKFQSIGEVLEVSDLIKYGLEIEVSQIQPTKFELLHKIGALHPIMQALGVPDDISDSILHNIDYRKKNENNRWTVSEDTGNFEVSTPILINSLNDINKIAAVCILLKALGARLNDGTGLHINIGVDYLECNAVALDNIMGIWRECEELFYKIANYEGTIIRAGAEEMAAPVADGMQKYFEKDGSVNLKSDKEMEEFLYYVQAENRLEKIISLARLKGYECWQSNDPEERRQAYHVYYRYAKEHPEEDDPTRWTSINFNHMKWNDKKSPGRIEIRLFDSSLDIKTILENLFLVLRLFEVSLKNAKDPNYKEDEFLELYRRDVNEETKLDNLLNLLFEKDEHKQIYKRRWESVKEHDIKYDFAKGSEETFIRE